MLKKIFYILIVLVLTGLLVYLLMPRLAVFYHNRGVDAFNNELYEKGVEFFNKSLYIMPNTDTYDYLAHTYERLGRLDDAAKLYNTIISISPSHAGAYIDLSRIYIESYMFEKAVALLENALDIIPEDGNIKKALDKAYLYYADNLISQSFILYIMGKRPKAYDLLYKTLKLNPDYAYAHYMLGYCYYSDENWDQAVHKLNDAIKIEPGHWQSYKLLGDIFFKKNEYSKAVDIYKKILQFQQYDYVIYNDIGISFMKMENYDRAIIYLKEALRLNPNSSDVLFNLASTYRDMGLFEQAVSEYHKLSSHDDGYPNMYNNLADIYNAQGKKDLALNAYRREMQFAQKRLVHNPDDLSELNTLARAYNGIGDCQKAKTIISRVIAVAPDYRDAYITLASIEEKQGNLEPALQALYTARSLTAHTDFIDRHIENINKKISTRYNPAIPVKAEKTFTPSHKIFFKSGKSIEGIMHKRTEKEITLYVQTANTDLEIILRVDNIDRIVAYNQ